MQKSVDHSLNKMKYIQIVQIKQKINFSSAQKYISVRRLLLFGYNKKMKLWSGLRQGNTHVMFDIQSISTFRFDRNKC